MDSRVREQIRQHLVKSALIAAHYDFLWWNLDAPHVVLTRRARIGERVGHDTAQIHGVGPQRAALIQASKQQ